MSDPNLYPKAFLPIRKRIRAVVLLILDGERVRAVKEGLSSTVFAEGALTTLLGVAAHVACTMIFPGADPDSTEGCARVARVQRALTQACITSLAREIGEAGNVKEQGHPMKATLSPS